MAILESKTGMTYEQMIEKMAEMAQTIEAMKAQKTKLVFKVSKQGGVSVYGMGRWPVTLYGDQWKRLLGAKEDILAFIEANKASLSVKE